MRRFALALALLATILAYSGLTSGGAQEATPPVVDDGIVGSWIVTAQGDGFSFVNVTSVLPGGVVINTADDGPAGHGAWTRTADGTYALTFVSPDFDDDGSLEGFVTVRAEATLGSDGSTFSGPFATEITDATGAVLFTYLGTVQAARIEVEPLIIELVASPEAQATPTT